MTLQTNLGGFVILTKSGLLTNGRDDFSFFKSFISFDNVLEFGEYELRSSCVKCFSKYFILGNDTINGIALLILFMVHC